MVHSDARLTMIVGLLLLACSEEAAEPSELDAPTWHRDIAAIVHTHCVSCHRPGGGGPFSLLEYADAAPWAAAMSEAVASQQMPPWGAHETDECRLAHAWVHDARVPADAVELLAAWVEAGAPEGDPDSATPLPELPDRSLAEPSVVLETPTPVVLEGTADSHVCVSFDLGLDRQVWVTGAELLPSNPAVVHHALFMLDDSGASAQLAGPDGRFDCGELHLGAMLGSYFPGSFATELPPDIGVPMSVGARVVVNFHYHPSGLGMDVDQSSLALRWTETPPSHEALISTIGNATTPEAGLLPGPNDGDGGPVFLIPAGVGDHTETMEALWPEGFPSVELLAVGPHMHELGTDFRAVIVRDGQEHCLLQDSSWNPEQQMLYTIDAQPGSYPRIQGGDRLRLRCTYDNSLDNPRVVGVLAALGLDTPIAAHMGSQGVDEMCMLVYALAIPRS